MNADTPNGDNPFSGANDDNGGNESYAAKLARELEQAKADKLALQQELSLAGLEDKDDNPDTIRQLFKPYLAAAITTVIDLSESAESESVRLSASKYIIEYGPASAGSDDEFKAFLNKIKSKPFSKDENSEGQGSSSKQGTN